MLFAMGVGSRISRFLHFCLLDTFVVVEFCLSLLCALSAVVAYSIAAHTNYTGLVIYAQATIIGSLIGLEIPLVTRLNEAYEELRINISGVLEKDYYGSLLGGLIFAFFALPYLGLTYTPILLGTVNFLVASLLLWRFFFLLERKKILITLFVSILVFLTGLAILAKPIIRYGEQQKYRDKIVFAEQTKYQKIVITQWKDYYWLYINGQEQFSTFDEYRYHEPLVHPAMKLSQDISNVLILGGGDGLALREILKYDEVKTVTLVDLDPTMTGLAKEHPILLKINEGSMNSPKVRIVNADASWFLEGDDHLYGVVIADLPDPDSIDLMHVYSEKFYRMIRNHLIEGGIMVTQATSSFFSHKAFLCILKTVRAAGFSAIAYHNQIPTMGQWGWVLGIKAGNARETRLKQCLLKLDFSDIPTRFLNNDAVISMTHFGKGVLDESLMSEIDINSELSPMLYRYYLQGSWGVY